MKPKEYAIIVAGGKGTRMQNIIPKQFILLHERPILMHTIEAFLTYSAQIRIILVLPADDITNWKALCERYKFSKNHIITPGGDTRFQSVRNGLNKITDDNGLVAIHDGVRPMVSADIIGASFRLAALHKSAIATVRLKESLRITDQDTTKAVDRSKYRTVQTPQTFELTLIKKAYNIKEVDSLTDDASVAEKAGFKISLFEGSYENIKITTPEDLLIAEALMRVKNKS